ncbi:MAG: ATP synthase subunit alpha [Microgenomates group bacterium GW2011_GWB1_44_8]|nr:MAG: ATP synthase subunit alpha [Microgenomates group bacterium GW2011_GWB1_44_8]
MTEDFAKALNEVGEIGYAEQVLGSVVYVRGLPTATPREVVIFESGQFGEVLFLTEDFAEVLLFSTEPVKAGTKVARTNQMVSVLVGEEQLGFIIDPLGVPLSFSTGYKKATLRRSVDEKTPGLENRLPITRPLETGVTVVDLLVPLAMGQRELIIGDRKTGKSAFLQQTALSVASKGHVCIYAAVAKKRNTIKRLEDFFVETGVMKNIIIVASTPQDPTGLIFLTPFSAMTLAEYYRDQGRDVVIILDDLTAHAKFYREISLLARRFPGRDSYPVDIFHLHARLLERAGSFALSGGKAASITALPTAETNMGDLSGYIQTNLMSMTDGHIFFDADIFSRGRRPAVNTFLSVTRVGRQTQTPLLRQISRELTSFLANFEKMQSYTHFGAELSATVKQSLQKGEKMTTLLDQTFPQTIPLSLQIFLFGLLWQSPRVDQNTAQTREYINKIISAYNQNADFKGKVEKLVSLSDSLETLLEKIRTQATQLL